MKGLVLCSAFIFVGSAALASVSLDSILAKQETITISPVEFNGKPVLSSPGPLPAAAKVCLAAGYKVVRSLTTNDEITAKIREAAQIQAVGNSIYSNGQEQEAGDAFFFSVNSTFAPGQGILTSVTCSR